MEELVTQIISAYVSNHHISAERLQDLIVDTYQTLASLEEGN